MELHLLVKLLIFMAFAAACAIKADCAQAGLVGVLCCTMMKLAQTVCLTEAYALAGTGESGR